MFLSFSYVLYFFEEKIFSRIFNIFLVAEGSRNLPQVSKSLQMPKFHEISRKNQYFFEFGNQKSTKNRKIIKSLDRDVYSSTKMSCIDSEPLGMKTGRDYFAGVKFVKFDDLGLKFDDLQWKTMHFLCKSAIPN